MKNLCMLLAVLSVGTAPVFSQLASIPMSEIAQSVQFEKEMSGREAISAIRKSFEQGQYDAFLKEMDNAYRAVQEKGGLGQLVEMRAGYASGWEDLELRTLALQNERSQELIRAVEGYPKSLFIERVLSASADISNAAHKSALAKIISFRTMAPGSGKTDDENKLIDLDLEYEYKLLHLDLPGSSIAERRGKQCALRMEKLGKMVSLSSTFQDAQLQEIVAIYVENFDTRLMQSWDIADLNALTTGTLKPTNALEEEVTSILILYQEKISDLK